MIPTNVSPIGTCRIHTPLRRAAPRFPFRLDLTRNYGFVHTSAEVLQQLDMVTGGVPVPSDLWPLIYRPKITAEFLARPPSKPDMFFFEISSAKHVTLGEIPLQLNYVNRHFGEFFAENAIARKFWALAREEHASERLLWLQTIQQFHRLPETDREMLSAIRMREQTAEEIAADMAAMVERVGADKAVFFTHVNARTPDSDLIASRAQLIEIVEKSAAALNIPCFNPSALMNEFGQAAAMERLGLDVTHFSLPFADHLGKIWFEKYIRHSGAVVDEMYLEQLERTHSKITSLRAQLEAGHIVEVARALSAALRSGDATDDHSRLMSQVAFTLGDFERTISLLEALRVTKGSVEEDDVLLMKAYLSKGDYLDAINLGRSLIADEREADEIVETCAIAAENLGWWREAVIYRRKLMRSGAPGEHITSLLTNLMQLEEFDEAEMLTDTILVKTPGDLPCLRVKWQIALMRRDVSRLVSLAEPLSALDDETLVKLVTTTWSSGLARPAATLLNTRLRKGSVQKTITDLAQELGAIWKTEGLAAFDVGDLPKALDLLGACIELAPNSGDSIRTARALERRLRAEVREAFAAKNHDRVMLLAEICVINSISFRGFDALIGRSAAVLDQFSVALKYLRMVAESDPSPANLLLLARTEAKAKHYDRAIAAYNSVLNKKSKDASPDQRKTAMRAVRSLFAGTVNASRQANEDGNVDLAWQLLKLLSVHSDKVELIQREQARIVRQMRQELNVFDPSDHAGRLGLANTVLSLQPTDIGARRIAAVSAMRTLNFSEAREHWRTLARQAELTPQIENAIAKCELWIERNKLQKAA